MDNETDGGDECQPTTSNTNGLCSLFNCTQSLFFSVFYTHTLTPEQFRCKQSA